MSYKVHDRALEALQGTGPELRDGAPNHAPMVVEALAALGRDTAVLPWIEAYRLHLAESPKAKAVLGADWQTALGDFSKLSEWQSLFRRELRASSWHEVLERWLPRLIPGSMAAGTHGIIRCGHATRALANEVTSSRLEELAAALAYCAGRYRTVGGEPFLAGPLGLEAAVRGLALLESSVDRRGYPPRVVQRLNERRDFTEAVRRLAPPTDITSALSELAEIGARLYLHDAARRPLVLLHAITGPAAVQLIIKNVSPEFGKIGFAYMWQGVAAWAAAFSRGLSDEQFQETKESWDTIIDLSVESGDDHAIKLTEACRRLEELRPSPIFRAAASDWVHRVIAAREWSPERLVDAGIRTRLRID